VTGEPSWIPPLHAGRRPAGIALLGWLDDERAPRLCRLTGSSGSGRTHLLRWLATACPADNPHVMRRVDVLLPAAGLTVRSLTWLLADRLGLVARTPAELAEAIASAGRPRVLAFTDLDRAGDAPHADHAERIATELLVPLLEVPGVRLLVESGDGTPAAAVLAAAVPGAATLDLDAPRWTDQQRFAAWCARLAVNAEQVYPSPGLARLAACVEGGVRLDASTRLAMRAAAVTAAWWQAVPEELRPAVRALAMAEAPVTAQDWAALPGAGGPDAVRRAGALLPAQADGLTWRLQPQQLIDRVTSDSPPVDHLTLAGELTAQLPHGLDGEPDLPRTEQQRLGHLLQHAVRAGTADQLLGDPAFLVHANPLAVTTALDSARPDEAARSPLAQAWHLAGPALVGLNSPADRAAVLHTWLTGRGQADADRLTAISRARWRACWAFWSPAEAVAAGRASHAGRIMVAAGGLLRVLDADSGRDTATPTHLPAVPVSLACSADGYLFSVDRSGNLVVTPDGSSRATEVARWAAKRLGNGLTALATLPTEGSPALAVGDADGGLSYFRTDREPGVTASLHQGPVTALGLTPLGDNVFLASGGADGQVRVWIPGRDPMPNTLDTRGCPVTAVTVAETARGLLVATAWADGAIRLRRLDAADTVLDLNLGSPARSAAIDAAGNICLALPEGIVSLRLD
jgi:hypothetical protein